MRARTTKGLYLFALGTTVNPETVPTTTAELGFQKLPLEIFAKGTARKTTTEIWFFPGETKEGLARSPSCWYTYTAQLNRSSLFLALCCMKPQKRPVRPHSLTPHSSRPFLYSLPVSSATRCTLQPSYPGKHTTSRYPHGLLSCLLPPFPRAGAFSGPAKNLTVMSIREEGKEEP